jgi:hypothetical protein
MLNVLTILTFIGSAFGFLGGLWGYFTVCKSAEKLANQEMPDMGGMLGNMMEKAIEMSIKQCDNRLVILVSTLVTVALCFFGALMMRRLKKQGFIIYILGELIGPASMAAILGASVFSGMMIIGAIIPFVMIILYATQQKYMVN